MDDYWSEDECLTILEQSPVAEFSLSSLRCLSMDQTTTLVSEEVSIRTRNSSFCDSVSSVPTQKLEPKMHSFALQRWVETEDESEMKCTNNKKDGEDEMKKCRERSWTGSPDWDFKEGCSYDVNESRILNGLLGENTLDSDVSCEFISLSTSKFPRSKRKITENSLRNNAMGKSSVDSIRSVEFSMTDSACDVRGSRFNGMSWVTMPRPSSSLYSPASSKLSERSGANQALHQTDGPSPRVSLDKCIRERNERSFLNRVKNEIDIEFLEDDEVDHGDDIEDDIESFGEVSVAYSHESSDDRVGPHPKSTIGRVLSLVVGIGAGAIFHVMK